MKEKSDLDWPFPSADAGLSGLDAPGEDGLGDVALVEPSSLPLMRLEVAVGEVMVEVKRVLLVPAPGKDVRVPKPDDDDGVGFPTLGVPPGLGSTSQTAVFTYSVTITTD